MSSHKKLTAGDEIDSRCLKCKDVTNHTIVAMVGEKVAKVQCNVCGGRHNYRPAQPAKPAAAGKRRVGAKGGARAAAPGKEAKAAAYFEEMIAGRDPAAARPYAMTASFEEGDLIDHAYFGLGLVTRKISPTRIEVLFREGSKVLVCQSPS